MGKWFSFGLLFTSLAMGAQGLRIAPQYEGLYKVLIHCPVAGACERLKDTTTLSIIDAIGKGVTITFHDARVGVPRYQFTVNRVDQGGAHLEADEFTSFGRSVEFVGDLDGSTGQLRGTLRDATYPFEIPVEGTRLQSPQDLYVTQASSELMSPLEIQGSYLVRRGGNPVTTLVIRKTLSGTPALIAAWGLGHGVFAHFLESEFLPEQGVLNLVAPGASGPLKWTLAIRRDSNGRAFGRGLGMSSSGQSYPIELFPQ